jgi:hypothetical protein
MMMIKNASLTGVFQVHLQVRTGYSSEVKGFPFEVTIDEMGTIPIDTLEFVAYTVTENGRQEKSIARQRSRGLGQVTRSAPPLT